MSERIDLDELDGICRAATPGPYSTSKPPRDADGWQIGVCIGGTMGGKVYATPPGGQFPAADARHFAACDPTTVGGLIDRIRELEAQARRTVDANGLTVEDELIALSALLEKGTVRRG